MGIRRSEHINRIELVVLNAEQYNRVRYGFCLLYSGRIMCAAFLGAIHGIFLSVAFFKYSAALK
jgi:hypothetical protein